MAIQIYATWIIYAVIANVCSQVAARLDVQIDRISYQLIFEGFYHFAKAYADGRASQLIDYLVENHRMLSLIKQKRKRIRLKDLQWLKVWGHQP